MPHAPTSEPALQARKQPTPVWRISLAALAGAVTITIFVLWLQPPPPRFELITAIDYERRTKRLALIRDAQAWMTRFSPKIFGFAPVQISAGYIITGPGGASDLTELPPPTFSTNAVRVWILASNDVARAERDLIADNSTHWLVNTSEGTPSTLSTGTPTPKGRSAPGSVEFANHPKIRGGDIDLAARFTSVVAGLRDRHAAGDTTNHIAFRMFLKRDEGGIIFDGDGALFIWAHAPPKQ